MKKQKAERLVWAQRQEIAALELLLRRERQIVSEVRAVNHTLAQQKESLQDQVKRAAERIARLELDAETPKESAL